MKREGNCFEDCILKLLQLHDSDIKLVHGLPLGRGGEAAKVGRYPHAWLERGGECWEPAQDFWMPGILFYALGNIEYTVKYDRTEVCEMLVEHMTYGSWDQTIRDRDDAIAQEFNA
jgi:hypothetical protein